jgi:hypothetical protein
MTAWEEVLSSALVGTERKAFTPPSAKGAVSALFAWIDPANAESALLSAAAILTMQRRSAVAAARLNEPQPAPAELDTVPRISVRSGDHLTQMLEGKIKEALPEWLRAAASAGLRVSEEYLPALLVIGSKDPDLRDLITPVIGKRGQWLAGLFPEWQYAVSYTTADWELLATRERALVLKALRAHDPDTARTLLESTWSSDPADARTEFISALEIGLSLADEPFLEAALDDRSKRVREIAADLLSRLPESALVHRMIEHVTRFVTLTRGLVPGIDVTLPEALDATMIRDGITPKPPSSLKIGERAWWLVSIISRIPPKWWADQWNMAPDQLVALASKSEWKEALLEGWIAASHHYPDVAWIRALLLEYPSRNMLVKGLSPQDCERAISPVIPRLEIAARFQLIITCHHLWSIEFGKAVLKEVTAFLKKNKSETGYWSVLHQIGLFGLYLPPALFSEAEDILKTVEAVEGYNPALSHVQSMVSTLDFRRQMLKELQNG